MNAEETKMLIRTMMTAWPNYRPEHLEDTVVLWANLLEPYPYPAILAALKAYIIGNHAFAPSPGQIIAYLPTKEHRSELEAWSLVRKALKNGNYGAEAEFEKLPEDVRKAVGSPEQIRAWAAAPEEETETVMQSNFLRSYRAVRAREEKYEGLPAALVEKLKEVGNVLELPG